MVILAFYFRWDMSGNEKEKLRIGLLIDSFSQCQWVYKIIQDIRHSDVAEAVLIMKMERSHKSDRKSIFINIGNKKRKILWKLYRELDKLIFQSEQDPFKEMDISSLLNDCSVLYVESMQKVCLNFFPEEVLSDILKYELDVVFSFVFPVLKGDSLDIARYGVWSFPHGDDLINRGCPLGSWECVQGDPVTGSILQILSPTLDGGRVIYRSWASTKRFSVSHNVQNCYWKTSTLAIQKLRELHQKTTLAPSDDKFSTINFPYTTSLYQAPNNIQTLRFLLKLFGRFTIRGMQKLFYYDQWCLAFKIGKKNSIACTFHDFRTLIPPKDRSWADPFPVEKEGKYYIFIEEFVRKKNKAHISVIEMDKEGSWKKPIEVLEKEYHLSHPFIFEWQSNYYMIPETAQNKTLELYRCVSFPFEWKLERVLMENIIAVDATLASIGRLWWLFVNIGTQYTGNDDELHLFYSDNPLGAWKPHKSNPVKSDVRCSRPAGRLFSWNGDLYRPAQDCSFRYGYAISMNIVLRITPEKFLEKEVSRILPTWKNNIAGIHTLNNSGKLTCIDSFIFRRRLF